MLANGLETRGAIRGQAAKLLVLAPWADIGARDHVHLPGLLQLAHGFEDSGYLEHVDGGRRDGVRLALERQGELEVTRHPRAVRGLVKGPIGGVGRGHRRGFDGRRVDGAVGARWRLNVSQEQDAAKGHPGPTPQQDARPLRPPSGSRTPRGQIREPDEGLMHGGVGVHAPIFLRSVRFVNASPEAVT